MTQINIAGISVVMNAAIPPMSITSDVNISWKSVIKSSNYLAAPALRFVLVLYATSCICCQNPQVPEVWGSKQSTDTQNGAFRQHSTSVGYIHDPDRYLPSHLNQHPGCVQFSVIGLLNLVSWGCLTPAGHYLAMQSQLTSRWNHLIAGKYKERW
jgi:hypothetical protein